MKSAKEPGPELRRALAEHLLGFVTARRRKKFEQNLLLRTRHLTIVLEDIYQPHNASAVLRTCECFGIQDVHIIENRNKYEVNPDVVLGASKWLTLKTYNEHEHNTAACLKNLKSQGYRLVATTPHKNDHTPESLPLDSKTALIFGTELAGLTPEALALADDYIRIPMVGFTESLNISVSAAIFLHTLTERLRNSGIHWQIEEPERTEVLLQWLKNTLHKSDLLVRDFVDKKDH